MNTNASEGIVDQAEDYENLNVSEGTVDEGRKVYFLCSAKLSCPNIL